MNEFILVEFVTVREVVIDGHASGYKTGEVIELAPGTHTISLAGKKNYNPAIQNVTPTGTSPIQPRIVHFDKV